MPTGCSPEKSSVIQLLGVGAAHAFEFHEDSAICHDDLRRNGEVGKL